MNIRGSEKFVEKGIELFNNTVVRAKRWAYFAGKKRPFGLFSNGVARAAYCQMSVDLARYVVDGIVPVSQIPSEEDLKNMSFDDLLKVSPCDKIQRYSLLELSQQGLTDAIARAQDVNNDLLNACTIAYSTKYSEVRTRGIIMPTEDFLDFYSTSIERR